ncbi:MAG: hypothetical protein AB7I13_11380, partial [Vicinamibacterales bacterium]
ACAAVLVGSGTASAQNWSFDAREIGLGGIGSGADIGASMIEEQKPYGSIVIPFGLLQIIPNKDVFDPGNDAFDPVRAAEYAGSPIHYIVNRDNTDSGQRFVSDIRNATLSRDLNTYRGFVPANQQQGGLANASWGGTIKVRKGSGGTFHGIYVGAGPYFSFQTDARFDDRLIDLLASPTPVFAPNTSFLVTDATTAQMALAVTGGYRGRFALPAGVGNGGEANGFYVAANYNYLRGFRLEDLSLGLRLDTDRTGLLTALPSTVPVNIGRTSSNDGTGAAIDVGIGAVVDRWQFGFGANGLGNRIDWTDVSRQSYTLNSLLTGGDFVESPAVPVDDLRVELPVEYRAHTAYSGSVIGGAAEYARGLQGKQFRGGLEFIVGRLALRGGARYLRDRWEPSGGLGFNLSSRVGIDVAAFSTSANVQRKRHLAIATSLRLMRKPQPPTQ